MKLSVPRLLLFFLCLSSILHSAAQSSLPAAHKPNPVVALAFSPSGDSLLSAAGDRLAIRSPTTGAIESEIVLAAQRLGAIAFHPTGKLLAIGLGTPGVTGLVQVIEWPGGAPLTHLGGFNDLITAVAWKHNGLALAAGSFDRTILLWEFSPQTRAFTPSGPFTGHSAAIRALLFSPDDRQLVTASVDRSVKVWSTADRTLVRTFSHHSDAVHALSLRPSTDLDAPYSCASAGDDRSVRIWQPGIGRMVRIVRGHPGPILALAHHPNGATLFSAGQDGVLRTLDTQSDRILHSWKAHDDWILALAPHPNGTHLASADWQGLVKIWPLAKTP